MNKNKKGFFSLQLRSAITFATTSDDVPALVSIAFTLSQTDVAGMVVVSLPVIGGMVVGGVGVVVVGVVLGVVEPVLPFICA